MAFVRLALLDLYIAALPALFSDEMSDSISTPEQTHGAPKLSQIATRAAIEHLKSVLPDANYCCGGTIPLSTSSPLTIRFDSAAYVSTNEIHKMQFPFPSPTSVEELLRASKPATFGVDGKAVFDEKYRKAAALDTSKFSTNWHPADCGILDAVTQVLLPDFGLRSEDMRKEHWGVRAELYKLNVYSGPSGKFDKHVDTPRGALQFGSLVVCLPYEHQGGALLVTHQKHTNTFDWSSTPDGTTDASSPAEIKWAAFYSDCTHEVQPVTSGHRITLTYNLYISEHSTGSLFTVPPTIDAYLYPLAAGARQMLSENAFMPEGGTLGFYCTHSYAHTATYSMEGPRDSQVENLMPFALKGVDAMLFQTFASLGVNVTVRPILHNEIFEKYWRYLDYEEQEVVAPGYTARVGDRFRNVVLADWVYEGEDPKEFINKVWGDFEEMPDLIWLNNPNSAGWQLSLVHPAYGNDPTVDWHYSHATILIDIPPRNERLVEIPKTGFPIDPSKFTR